MVTSVILAISLLFQLKGFLAMIQDCQRRKKREPEAEPAQAANPRPVPPAPPPVPEAAQEPQAAGPRIVHHHIFARPVNPDQLFVSPEGRVYHLDRNCQHIRARTGISRKVLCQTCYQRQGINEERQEAQAQQRQEAEEEAEAQQERQAA